MKISIDELTSDTRPLEEIVESETIVPKRIGFCGNQISSTEFCGAKIMDDDVLAVELEVDGRKKYCCGPCVESLLFPHIPTRASEDPRKLKAPELKIRDFQRRPSKVERAI